MATGHKTGGRRAGTPNKRTADVECRLAALGCDPIEGMARIAMDESNPPELRGRMFAELAPYIAPKRRAIEAQVTAQVSHDVQQTQVIDSRALTREQRQALRELLQAAMKQQARVVEQKADNE